VPFEPLEDDVLEAARRRARDRRGARRRAAPGPAIRAARDAHSECAYGEELTSNRAGRARNIATQPRKPSMAMSENPYQPPQSDVSRVTGIRSGRRRHLRDVAVAQKVILVCILVEILAAVGQFVVPPSFGPIILAAYGIASLAATIFVFILAM